MCFLLVINCGAPPLRWSRRGGYRRLASPQPTGRRERARCRPHRHFTKKSPYCNGLTALLTKVKPAVPLRAATCRTIVTTLSLTKKGAPFGGAHISNTLRLERLLRREQILLPLLHQGSPLHQMPQDHAALLRPHPQQRGDVLAVGKPLPLQICPDDSRLVLGRHHRAGQIVPAPTRTSRPCSVRRRRRP